MRSFFNTLKKNIHSIHLKGEVKLNEKIFASLEKITAACLDKDGNYIAIPVLSGVRFINDEMCAYVERFCDGSGNEVDDITSRLIIKKLQSQVN